MSAGTEYIVQRLMAYILPRQPTTEEQAQAFNAAVLAQEAYEAQFEESTLPASVTGVTIGNTTVSLDDRRFSAYTEKTISPAAHAILLNAGLLRRTLPTARRP